VTSLFGIKVCIFQRFSRKRQDGSAPIFFQDLRESTCSLQPAFKSFMTALHPAFNTRKTEILIYHERQRVSL